MDEYDYERTAAKELKTWKRAMQRKQPLLGVIARQVQSRINRAIPDKVHEAITSAIKQMTRAVCFGAEFTTSRVLQSTSLQERETKIDSKIKLYSRTAAVEGAVTGGAGILLGLADFPLWLTVKMKMLFDIAALYGHDVKDFRERIYLLYIFEATFSKQGRRREIFPIFRDWDQYAKALPDDIDKFDWKTFQQEYRDYIDLAKLLQLVPGIGAPIGAIVNLRLTNKLGRMAKNAYRLRRPELTV
ncbi:MAG TPA: EcsC family protein [Cyclobacteriaceae bacterium]|nr:EcsC family protein [Cyclobacteriaceae bacterium]